MKRASYREAVAWIANFDAPGDDEDPEALQGLLTVALVADLFDVPEEKVARDVYRKRGEN